MHVELDRHSIAGPESCRSLGSQRNALGEVLEHGPHSAYPPRLGLVVVARGEHLGDADAPERRSKVLVEPAPEGIVVREGVGAETGHGTISLR
ncbi:hypothetical protein AAIB33_14685 [Microbacterium sp. AZCO]|uniref:hypothetical protein n=1 Tax=Microbacterium sp. AZCO TaxID=3142976 RepID=UPI0031F3BA87